MEHRPEYGVRDTGTQFLILPPFGEELNRARRMLAWQARELAGLGFGALLLDLSGTGDSDGTFGEATWERWLADVAAAADWLRRERGGSQGLLALRSGALLGMSAARRGEADFERIVLWQPLLSGEDFLRQFLRLRVAAQMAGPGEGEGSETVASLRARLEAGDTLDVAGYALQPELALPLAGSRLQDLAPAQRAKRLDWLERAVPATGAFPPRSAAVAKAWQAEGLDVRARTFTGEAFWSATELTLAPDLVARTIEGLSEE